MKRSILLLSLLLPLSAFGQQLTIRADRPTVEVSPLLYGVFFEDINYAADGGLNTNLVQNPGY